MAFLLFVVMVTMIIVPIRHWKNIWISGIVGLLLILVVDNTLTVMGAFQFNHGGIRMLRLPLPYWLSYFFGGMVFAYYRPEGKWKRLLHVLSNTALLWVLEMVMVLFGFFQYLNWNMFRSFLLDIGGFVFFAWVIEWLNIPGKADRLDSIRAT